MPDLPMTRREVDLTRQVAELERENASIKGRLVPLTRTQRDLLAILVELKAKNGGIVPSYDELAAELGLAGKSGIARLLEQIESKGWIRRFSTRARGIYIIHRPEMPDLVDPTFSLAPDLMAAAQ